MKGISICSECANYDMKKHKCRLGCKEEINPKDPFYDDCPLPDVACVVHGQWNITRGQIENAVCSCCGTHFQSYYSDYQYCPRCGAKMQED